jgi:hypothetical protein
MDNTSWSCAHGIERWRSDCGCNSGKPGWRQHWRAPLRGSLDWLRDQVAPRYEAAATELFKDPWAARNAYIDVILDRSPASIDRFLATHARRPLSDAERVRALKLLELQRQALLMYTSCGWFFDDISGIETVQVLAYAGRCIQLADETLDLHLETEFLRQLEGAPSNVPRYGNARIVYETHVRATKVDLRWVAAHFAFASMFQTYDDHARVHSFDVAREAGETLVAGRAKLSTGRLRIRSRVTLEDAAVTFAALHLGDHNLHGGVRFVSEDPGYNGFVQELTEAFRHARLTDAISMVSRHFGDHVYSVRQLFRDEQRRIVGLALDSTLEDFDTSFHRLYERSLPLAGFLTDLGQPLPKEFRMVSEFVINQALRRAFSAPRVNAKDVASRLAEAQKDQVQLDREGLAYAYQGYLERVMEAWARDPKDLTRLETVAEAAAFARSLPFDVSLWRSQNDFSALLRSAYPQQKEAAESGSENAKRWIAVFVKCAGDLNIHVTEP